MNQVEALLENEGASATKDAEEEEPKVEVDDRSRCGEGDKVGYEVDRAAL